MTFNKTAAQMNQELQVLLKQAVPDQPPAAPGASEQEVMDQIMVLCDKEGIWWGRHSNKIANLQDVMKDMSGRKSIPYHEEVYPGPSPDWGVDPHMTREEFMAALQEGIDTGKFLIRDDTDGSWFASREETQEYIKRQFRAYSDDGNWTSKALEYIEDPDMYV